MTNVCVNETDHSPTLAFNISLEYKAHGMGCPFNLMSSSIFNGRFTLYHQIP